MSLEGGGREAEVIGNSIVGKGFDIVRPFGAGRDAPPRDFNGPRGEPRIEPRGDGKPGRRTGAESGIRGERLDVDRTNGSLVGGAPRLRPFPMAEDEGKGPVKEVVRLRTRPSCDIGAFGPDIELLEVSRLTVVRDGELAADDTVAEDDDRETVFGKRMPGSFVILSSPWMPFGFGTCASSLSSTACSATVLGGSLRTKKDRTILRCPCRGINASSPINPYSRSPCDS